MLSLSPMLLPALLAAAIATVDPASPTAEPPQPPCAPPGVPAPTPAPQAVTAAADPEVDALLDELERSAADLTGFTADLMYTKWDPVMAREENRTGRIILDSQPRPDHPPTRRIAIAFDTIYQGQRKQTSNKHYVFDGCWLAEIDFTAKTLIQHRIVAPGEQFDPLKLGEGPFPLPIGQPKTEVLARFHVTRADLPQHASLAALKDFRGMRLTPKADAPEAKQFLHVDLYYDRQSLLPVGIETVSAKQVDPKDPGSRERKIVLLANVVRNPALTPEQQQMLCIIAPDPAEWKIQVD
jgi:hypothetical protein